MMNASEPFLDMIDEEDELTAEELEKITRIYSLMKSKDENFASYIGNNALLENYQEDTERISQFVTAVNDLLLEMDDIGKTASEGDIPKVNTKSMLGNIGAASGKEQKKQRIFSTNTIMIIKHIQKTCYLFVNVLS